MSAILSHLTVFELATLYVEAEVVTGGGEQIQREIQVCRIVSVGAMIASAALSLQIARIAFAAIPSTYGLSALLLVPNVAFGLIVSDGYRAIKCCNIILERVNAQAGLIASTVADLFDAVKFLTQGRPDWVSKLRAELDSSSILSYLSQLHPLTNLD